MPAGVLTVVSALVYGLIRFRDPFEVCLAVLAAPPIVLLAGAVQTQGHSECHQPMTGLRSTQRVGTIRPHSVAHVVPVSELLTCLFCTGE